MKRAGRCFASRRAPTYALACLLLLGPRLAGAQESKQSLADGLFRTARLEMRAGDYAAACPKLEESYRLDPASGTLLNIAICHEKLGHEATAWTNYVRFVETVPAADDRVRFARSHIEALAPHLPRLRIVSPDAPTDASLFIDGVELGVASVGVDIPVDEGEHRAEMIWPDGRRTQKSAEVRRDQRIEIELGAPFSPPTRTTTPAEGAPMQIAAPTAHEKRRPRPARHERVVARDERALRTAGYVSGGIGVLGFVGAAIFSAVAMSKKSTVAAHCPRGFCDDEGLRTAGDARALLRAADVALVAGGIGVLTGGALLFEVWNVSPRASGSTTGCLATFSGRF
jgi:hypothetical protein